MRQDIPNHLHSQLMRRTLVCGEVVSDIHEHLIDAVDMNVVCTYVLEVGFVDAGTDLDVLCHLRRGNHKVQLQAGIRF